MLDILFFLKFENFVAWCIAFFIIHPIARRVIPKLEIEPSLYELVALGVTWCTLAIVAQRFLSLSYSQALVLSLIPTTVLSGVCFLINKVFPRSKVEEEENIEPYVLHKDEKDAFISMLKENFDSQTMQEFRTDLKIDDLNLKFFLSYDYLNYLVFQSLKNYKSQYTSILNKEVYSIAVNNMSEILTLENMIVRCYDDTEEDEDSYEVIYYISDTSKYSLYNTEVCKNYAVTKECQEDFELQIKRNKHQLNSDGHKIASVRLFIMQRLVKGLIPKDIISYLEGKKSELMTICAYYESALSDKPSADEISEIINSSRSKIQKYHFNVIESLDELFFPTVYALLCLEKFFDMKASQGVVSFSGQDLLDLQALFEDRVFDNFLSSD